VKETPEDKLLDWGANEISLAMAGAYFRGNLNLSIFPDDKRPDYEYARKIIKKLKAK
jgi:hypothetical protein